jgi:hypothetical protein
VQLDGDARVADVRLVVGGQHIADLGGYRVADVFLPAGQRDLRAVRVTEQDPERDSVIGFRFEQVELRAVLLGQEELPARTMNGRLQQLTYCNLLTWLFASG